MAATTARHLNLRSPSQARAHLSSAARTMLSRRAIVRVLVRVLVGAVAAANALAQKAL
jgi:hypothetical protein